MNSPLRFHALGFAGVGAVMIAVIMGAPLVQPRPESAQVQLDLGTPSPPITLAEYLEQRDTTSGPIVNTGLTRDYGRVITYTVAPPPGTENAPCQLRWTEQERHHGRAAAESSWRYEGILGWPDGLLVNPVTGEKKISGQIWVPLPNPLVDAGQFVVHLRLGCGALMLSEVDSTPFRVDVAQASKLAASP